MPNLKKLLLVSGATAIVGAMALTGCQTGRGGTEDRTAGRAMDDKNITAQIEEKLQREPTYKFTDVDVKTFRGVVQLSGFVSTDEQKQRAGELAQSVDGVFNVVNAISLKPAPLTPTGMTNQVNQPSTSGQ